VVLVGCVVSVAACGGGGDPTGALTDAFDGVDADVPQPDRVEPDHAESGGTPVEVRPPEFFLTGSLDAPAGTARTDATLRAVEAESTTTIALEIDHTFKE